VKNPRPGTKDRKLLFDVYGLNKCGCGGEVIAIDLRRSDEEVQTVLDYIADHTPEVEADYREYLASPELAVPNGEIHDRGRGPEIKGSRITVYNVLDYYLHGYHHSVIANILRLTPGEILTAINYINAHWAEVMPPYIRGVTNAWLGNSPEILAKCEKTRQKLKAWLQERTMLKRLNELDIRQPAEMTRAEHRR